MNKRLRQFFNLTNQPIDHVDPPLAPGDKLNGDCQSTNDELIHLKPDRNNGPILILKVERFT